MLPAIVAAAFLCSVLYVGSALAEDPRPAGTRAGPGGEVIGIRLGRHTGFLRLVFDLTARPAYTARATGAATFEVVIPGVSLPPEGQAALAADPLAPDLIVRPADPAGSEEDGALRFGVASRFAAFIRRVFVLEPPAGGGAAETGHWRLVLDVVPRPGTPAATATGQFARADLPPIHGMESPIPGAGLNQPSASPAQLAAEPSITEPGPGRPAQVEVSWARASRILRELQTRQVPDAEAAIPPQLVLAPKYRRPMVPLR